MAIQLKEKKKKKKKIIIINKKKKKKKRRKKRELETNSKIRARFVRVENAGDDAVGPVLLEEFEVALHHLKLGIGEAEVSAARSQHREDRQVNDLLDDLQGTWGSGITRVTVATWSGSCTCDKLPFHGENRDDLRNFAYTHNDGSEMKTNKYFILQAEIQSVEESPVSRIGHQTPIREK